jgi:hypothetical protein
LGSISHPASHAHLSNQQPSPYVHLQRLTNCTLFALPSPEHPCASSALPNCSFSLQPPSAQFSPVTRNNRHLINVHQFLNCVKWYSTTFSLISYRKTSHNWRLVALFICLWTIIWFWITAVGGHDVLISSLRNYGWDEKLASLPWLISFLSIS